MPLKEKSEKNINDGSIASEGKTGGNSKLKTKNFPIVCLGGSAGAFPAMEKFFTHMPTDAGVAIIVIMHLNPTTQGIYQLSYKHLHPSRWWKLGMVNKLSLIKYM